MLHSDNSYDCLRDKKKRVCLAFSKLYSFVKSNFRQNVYRENKTHILSGHVFYTCCNNLIV